MSGAVLLPLAHGGATGHGSAADWLGTVLVMTVPAALYLAGVGRVRARGRRWSRRRTGSFGLGLLLLGVAVAPALDAAGDARSHMVQHLLLGMYAPIALVMAAPMTLLLAASPVAARRPVARVLRSWPLHVASHVTTAAVLSVGGLYVLYLTPVYAWSTRSDFVHHLVHVHFLVAGCLFAWAVAGPDPAPRRPGTGVRLGVLVVAGGAHAFLAKLLYARAPDLPPGSGHGAGELEVAAQWMYHGGHLADLLLLTALFAAGYRRAGRRQRAGRDRSVLLRPREVG